jgi:hypothetical protein
MSHLQREGKVRGEGARDEWRPTGHEPPAHGPGPVGGTTRRGVTTTESGAKRGAALRWGRYLRPTSTPFFRNHFRPPGTETARLLPSVFAISGKMDTVSKAGKSTTICTAAS